MARFPTRVLLATDGSEDAALAARTAVDLTDKSGSELHLVHAWTNVPSPHFEGYIRAGLEEEGRRVLDEEARRIEAAGADLAGAHLGEGRTQEVIVDLAEEIGADLIVVGSRGMGTIGSFITGSVSEGVVHLASCPVLVMRDTEKGAWPPKKIVVGDDGSEEAKRTAQIGARIGEPYGAEAVLLRARPPLTMTGAGSAANPHVVEDVLREDEQDLEQRAAELEEALGRRARVKVVVADPAGAIRQEADEDDEPALVAVGRRGMGGVKRLVLGSVSSKTLRTVSGPVLVV
ncbi:MAG: universal stress protein [Actinomycetota bacterium]|nr:universal stress protein [Actinomycetota bacterium]